MPSFDAPDRTVCKSFTPAGGMVLSIMVGGGLWSALAIGMHVAGVF